MIALASLDEIAAHLHAGVLARDGGVITWRRSEASPTVEIRWDDARGALWIRVPLGIDTARFDPGTLARAVAAINIQLEVFGVELDAEPTFVSHVFFDADGRVSPSAIDRLLVAVDECVATTAAVIARTPQPP